MAGGAFNSEPTVRALHGRVLHVRRHGKALAFLHILPEGSREPLELVFNSQFFNHACSRSPFPTTKSSVRAGDVVCIDKGVVEHSSGDRRLCIERWTDCVDSNENFACPFCDGLGGNFPDVESFREHLDVAHTVERDNALAEVEFDSVKEWRIAMVKRSLVIKPGPTSDLPRRAITPSGKAACAGWVCCPLCNISSQRRFNRGPGLRNHLEMAHVAERNAIRDVSENAVIGVEEWHRDMAEKAEKLGVASRRGAGGRGPSEGTGRHMSMEGRGKHKEDVATCPALEFAQNGDVAALSALISEGWRPFTSDSLDHNGASALDWAAGGGHTTCVELLLPYADGLQVCRRDGRGPAHWAARHGRLDVLEFLVQAKANVDTRTTNGTSMLMLAGFGGHIEVAASLLAHGADMDARNAWDCDVGHFAAMGGSVPMCQWLIEKGLALDRRQVSGHSALHKAADSGQIEVLSYLLDVGLAASQLQDLRNLNPAYQPKENSTRRRTVAHLPSVLAQKQGHDACAALLIAANL